MRRTLGLCDTNGPLNLDQMTKANNKLKKKELAEFGTLLSGLTSG